MLLAAEGVFLLWAISSCLPSSYRNVRVLSVVQLSVWFQSIRAVYNPCPQSSAIWHTHQNGIAERRASCADPSKLHESTAVSSVSKRPVSYHSLSSAVFYCIFFQWTKLGISPILMYNFLSCIDRMCASYCRNLSIGWGRRISSCTFFWLL